MDIQSVRAVIAQKLASDPEQSFTVITNAGATAGTVISIADAAREAGVKQVNWPAEKKQ